MIPIRVPAGAAWLVAAVLLGAPLGELAAQTPDARVPAPGVLRFRVDGLFATYGERFGHPLDPGDGTRERLRDERFETRITDRTFEPFGALLSGINTLLATGEAPPAALDSGSVELLTSRLELRADNRRVGFELDVGVSSRIAVGIRLPLVQHWLAVRGFEVADGNVGFNPDAAGNAELLATIDPGLATLGGGAFLPVAGTSLGQLLQQQVRDATGGSELLLPTEPLNRMGTGGLDGAGEIVRGRYSPAFPGWELGDLEVGGSLALARRGPPSAGQRASRGLRATLDAAARLPTGNVATANYLALPRPLQGLGGASAALRADYLGGRFGAFASGRVEHLRPVTLEQAYRELPEPGEEPPPPLAEIPPTLSRLRWDPGTRVEVQLLPYFHLVDEIRVFAGYGLERRSESYRFEAGGEAVVPDDEVTATARAHGWAAGIEYSSLDAYTVGRASIPLEALLIFRERVAGVGGAPALRSVEMQARLFIRIWGRS